MPAFDDGSRVSFGADEFVFVELSAEMSLATTLRVIAITDELRNREIPGLVDICPAHVSYMVRVSPEELDPRDVVPRLADIHRAAAGSVGLTIRARVIDLPIFYNDPWTHETLMRFRDRHQAPDLTDLEYSARLNGFQDVDELIAAHSSSPFIATFIGFVPGNAESYQLVPRDRQLEVPKYLRPRTDTPARALGHGGAFTTIYPVRGAGGFQLFGRSPLPVFDAGQRLPDFADSIVLPRSGDIFKYRPIDRDEYDDLRRQVEQGDFRYRIHETVFDLGAFTADPVGYNRTLLEVLADD
ncbi:5-oxoprolinase subunit B family protein [Actinomadura formosensis]|uniref:5-oxoprolinase subunit B family protein n=1 Tax=Actinomadura formosensis TaxID=60706 RepID=UPI00082AFE2D|nr:carboxyltransferase domain-containing protein [Actinomadura formosensis]